MCGRVCVRGYVGEGICDRRGYVREYVWESICERVRVRGYM